MKQSSDSGFYWPIAYEVIAGQTYYWCGCGKCEAKITTDVKVACEKNVPYKAIVSETVLFCGCGKTKSQPFCDGSHAEH